MYQIIEYDDYRKNIAITLHGYSSQQDTALTIAKNIAKSTRNTSKNEFIYINKENERDNEYVTLLATGKIITQYSTSIINTQYLENNPISHFLMLPYKEDVSDECDNYDYTLLLNKSLKVLETDNADEMMSNKYLELLLENKVIDINELEELYTLETSKSSRVVAVVYCEELY